MSDPSTPLTRLQQEVYDLICVIAAKGRTMPSNGYISDKIGTSGATSVADIINRLIISSLIEVERVGYARIVTITQTGERTGTPDEVDHQPIQGLKYANREPCFHCGVRADAAAEFKCGECR